MLFRQFVNEDLGCASYLIGCEAAREAFVVDPPYAVEPLLEEASRHGVRIVRTVETHTHADHISGHGRLALEQDVPVSIHPAAVPAYPFDPFTDGMEITVGDITLRCIHTPGHRPEHCCVAVIDHTRADEPWLVLTGDSLFVGDAARPDLAVGAVEGAEGLFASLHRLLKLPDGVEVFPGHVAGSLCGKGMSSKASTTIGFERRFNPKLLFPDAASFVAETAMVDAPKPPNLGRIVAANSGPWIGAPAPVPRCDAPPDGTSLLDVRDADAFFASHRPGSVNVPVSASGFSTKAGFVLAPDRPVTVLAAVPEDADRAITGLRSIACFDVAAIVLEAGGPEHVTPVALDELERLLADAEADLIDVRDRDEHDAAHIPGSRHIPYRMLRDCCPDLPHNRMLVTICETGARAGIGASLLRGRGYDARPVLADGIPGWRARGGPLTAMRRCGA